MSLTLVLALGSEGSRGLGQIQGPMTPCLRRSSLIFSNHSSIGGGIGIEGVLDPEIQFEAEKFGLKLSEVITEANKPKKGTHTFSTAEGPKRLASFLSKLDDKKDPDELAEHLKEWIDSNLVEAVEHLKKCLLAHGRSPKTGYIKLRAEADEKKDVA